MLKKIRSLCFIFSLVSIFAIITSCESDDENPIQKQDVRPINLTIDEVTERSFLSLQLNSSFDVKSFEEVVQKMDSSTLYLGFLIAQDTVSIPLDYEHAIKQMDRNQIKQGKVCAAYCFADFESGAMSYRFYMLQPGQKYKYRSFIAIGDKVFYSDISEFAEVGASDVELEALPAQNVSLFEVQLNATVSTRKFKQLKSDLLGYRGIVYSLSSTSPLQVQDAIWEANYYDKIKEQDTYYWIDDLLTNDEFHCSISRIPTGKEIYYRAFVRVNGINIYSETMSTKTGDISCLQLATLPAEEVGLTSAILKATHCHKELARYSWDYGYSLGFVYDSKISALEENVIKQYWGGAYHNNYDKYLELHFIENDIFETTISGLTPETTYYYRPIIHLGDEWIFGEIMNFTAKALTIETLPASDVTYNHAYLNGQISEDVSQSNAFVRSGFVLSTDSNIDRLVKEQGEQVWSSNPIENGKVYYTQVPDYYSQFYINGLRPETTYYYRMFVDVNGIRYGDVQSFTTTKRPEFVNKFKVTGSDDWELREDGTYVSTNHEHSSASSLRATYKYEEGDRISFDWTVSSESYSDFLIIYIDGVEKIRHSGKDSGQFKIIKYTSGVANIEIKYVKNKSYSSGDDEATIKFTCYDMD